MRDLKARYLVVAALVVTFPLDASSQAPLAVRREFVLPTAGLGVANAVIGLREGGFAAVGYADAGSGTEAVLVRFDEEGDTLWARSYRGDVDRLGWDVVEAEDGGFFIAGFTEPPTEGREDILVLRVDERGGLVWERTFGGSGRDRAWSAALSEDGSLVVAAEAEEMGGEGEPGHRDAFILCVGEDGTRLWERRLSAPGDQRVFQISRASDGAFVVAGTTAPDTRAARDVFVARVDPAGSPLWTRTYGEEPDDVGHGVLALPSGDVLVTGYGRSRSHGGSDVYLLRIDAQGSLRWWRNHGGPEEEHAMMTAPGSDGGFATVGYTMTSTGADMMVMELGTEGELEVRTPLGRPGNDRAVMIVPAGPGTYVLAGTLGGSSSSSGDFTVLWLERGGPQGRDRAGVGRGSAREERAPPGL
jgi:hypothetical protein